MTLAVRPAAAADIPDLASLWRAAAGVGTAADPVWLEHELATGDGVLALDGDRPVGFGVLITRGEVSNLAELFVDPAAQSRGVGARILAALLPRAAPTLVTVSSGDLRAIALYTRHGMAPRWPFYYLVGETPRLRPPAPSLSVAEADWSDPAFLTSDLKCSGRPRALDLPYLRTVRGARPLWFRRGATTVGYGCIQTHAGEFTDGSAVIGPVGARTPRDAVACTLAAVAAARALAPVVRVALPGPHPALAPLLDAGFTIADADTFMARHRPRYCNPRTYLPSGPEFL